MYLRKMSPSTMCLYSAASMLLRSASAAAQSLASRPFVALAVASVAAGRFARLRRGWFELREGSRLTPKFGRQSGRATTTELGAPVPLSLLRQHAQVVADLYAMLAQPVRGQPGTLLGR